MGSNLLLFGKRRMPNGTYGVVRGVRAISPPTRFHLVIKKHDIFLCRVLSLIYVILENISSTNREVSTFFVLVIFAVIR